MQLKCLRGHAENPNLEQGLHSNGLTCKIIF